MFQRILKPRRWPAVCGAVTAAALAAASLVGGDGSAHRGPIGFGSVRSAQAAVPVGTPVFTDPLTITNSYFPFPVGGVKVFAGSDEGEATYVVDLYTTTTRTFTVGSTTVEARMLQETEFADGELAEISYNYFAQADDGTVYYFGEVVDNYEDGAVTDHDGSWLVGGAQPGDPVEVLTASVPAVYCLGDPEVGDVFKPEDVPGGPDETDLIQGTTKTVRVPAGRFTNCLQISERDLDGHTEKKYWAPGTGVILAKGKNEILKLVASTFQRP